MSKINESEDYKKICIVLFENERSDRVMSFENYLLFFHPYNKIVDCFAKNPVVDERIIYYSSTNENFKREFLSLYE